MYSVQWIVTGIAALSFLLIGLLILWWFYLDIRDERRIRRETQRARHRRVREEGR